MSELPNLFGHEKAIALWKEALQNRRIHHAWLLCGMRGIGKLMFARWLASWLLDVSVESSIESHPDLLILEREKDDKKKRKKQFITVDNVRRVSDFFSKCAGRGGWRVCIVNSADDMNHSAANALLKILEEPPARAMFLLVSHRPERLLVTLLSRCRRLRLGTLSETEMSRLLRHEHPEISPEEHKLLLLLAGGSPGRARALLGKDGTSQNYEKDCGQGLELYREMLDLLHGLPGNFDMEVGHSLADRLSSSGRESLFREFMEILRDFLERFICAGLDKSRQGQLPEIESRLLERLRPRNLEPWVEILEKIDSWIDGVERLQMNRKQTLLLAFAQLEGAACLR